MNKLIGALVLLVCTAGCGPSAGGTATASDTLTRAQKDSIVADLPVPGAAGVGRAIEAATRAGERAQRHDTLR